MEILEQIKKRYKKEAEKIPVEVKKKFINNLKKGKTIGEARKLSGIDKYEIEVACEIIINNMKSYSLFVEEDEIK